MAWVKKNLFLLITAVISLGLLGYAIFFVKGKMDADAAITATLDENAQKFKQLLDRKVHPGNEKINNIEKAKEELVKMRSFMDEMREYIKGPPQATNLNNQVFRANLDTSITEMRRMAAEANVALPNTNYWFTFGQYRSAIDFKDMVQGLSAQLADIKTMMRVLCDARVHSIVSLRRVGVTDTEYGSNTELINGRQPKTNDWAITTGYEMTFQGFSSELARVMEGIANAKECFVVKSVGVAQAPEDKSKAAPAAPIFVPQRPMFPGGGPMGPYSDRGRYGMGPGYGMPPPVAMPQPAARPAGTQMQRVLDESKLRFTVQLDSIRLKPKAQQQPATQPKTQVSKAGEAKPAEGQPTAAAPAAPAAAETTAAK